MQRRMRTVFTGALAAVALNLAGCATPNQPGGETSDPFEGMNRTVFAFNKVVDRAVLGPASQAYVAVTPEPARQAIFNFLDNLAYLTTAINQFLQGKIERGFEDTGRFVFNSTFGIAGLIDFASGVGLERHDEDFDQTLAVWGVGPGPYLELPVLGPNTLRGIPGLVADTLTDIKTWFGDPYGWIATGVDVVDTRARLDSAIRLRDRTALDPYVFQREAFMQRRRSLVFDGNPPLDEPSSTQ
jgi:phospholipid-binding lipoprotein MlaA